jgi:hypothetical protein
LLNKFPTETTNPLLTVEQHAHSRVDGRRTIPQSATNTPPLLGAGKHTPVALAAAYSFWRRLDCDVVRGTSPGQSERLDRVTSFRGSSEIVE